MKQKIFAILACLMACTMGFARQYETVPGDITGTRIYTLDNGLKVYLSVNKEKPRIQTYVAVRTGSRNDPAETTGLAHYLEHLMFKGTKQFGTSNPVAEAPLLDTIEARYEQYRHVTDPALRKVLYHQIDSISQLAAKYNIPNEYDKLMAAIGSDGSNAYTSNDVTCYTEDIPANEIENWARVQSDRFMNMVIRGFHTELEAVYEEKNISMAKDNWKMFEAMNLMLYPTHPYGTQTTIGTQEHLKNPSITNIKKYYNRYYCPNNVAICMAGDLDFDKTIAIIDSYFGQWKPNPSLSRPEFAPLAPITTPRDTTVLGQEAEFVAMAWRMPATRCAESDTLQLVNDILSNGTAGLIDADLVQKMKLLDAGSMVDEMADYSAFYLVGNPKEGQSLEEVRDLLLTEVAKVRNGEFSDELIQAVKNNYKRNNFEAADNYQAVAGNMVDAFVMGRDWSAVVNRPKSIDGITKQQIVAFANRYFCDNNYAICYKKQGEDTSLKKIEKPAITPIPTNREMQSQFVADITNANVEPIKPQFVDFKRDMTVTKTRSGLPVLYKQNTDNGLFTLCYVWKFGTQADKRLNTAFGYMDYLGTSTMTNEQFKLKMYGLACDYSFSASGEYVYVQLHGLSENMEQAAALIEQLMADAQPDQDAYDMNVELILKDRADAKTNQQQNFSRLRAYGIYGDYNPLRNIMSEQELRNTKPAELLGIVKGLNSLEHTVLYYGPATQQQLIAAIAKSHKTPKKLSPVPANKDYTAQPTPQNEVLIAPYEAKNIYMMQYNNEQRPYSLSHEPVVRLFNEYFGGGMNTIVFQELREARGLAYSASASYVTPSDIRHSEHSWTYIVTQNDKMPDCVKEFNNILTDMPQSEKAFALAKSSLTKTLESSRTTKASVLWAYLAAQKLGIDYDLDQKVYEALPTLQLADIVKFEKDNMASKPRRYIILGDEKELDMDFLKDLGPIRRVTTAQIFGY